MFKRIFAGCSALLATLGLGGCNDTIHVRQAYDFGLSTWYLQERIKPGEAVEIRFSLWRECDYKGAAYRIGYVQMQGDGFVFDKSNTLLVNRELCNLAGIADLNTDDPCRQVFTLYYRQMSEGNAKLQFIVTDNFGQERTLTVSFVADDKD